MAHNLDLTQGGLVITVNGQQVKVAAARMFSDVPQWHKLGEIRGGMKAVEIPDYLDSEKQRDPQLAQLYVKWGGKLHKIDFGMIARIAASGDMNDAPIMFGNKPVEIGNMTTEDWNELNPNGTRRVSKGYEIVSPRQIAAIASKVIRDHNGNEPLWTNAGYLGAHGKSGFFMGTHLPNWDADVAKRLGTEVEERFQVFLDWKNGNLYALNSSIVMVCENTAFAAVEEASTLYRVEHYRGAEARLEDAMSGVWSNALVARQLSQEAAMLLADKPATIDDVERVANIVYPNPGEPDMNLKAVQSDEKRWATFDYNTNKMTAMREAAMQMWTNEKFHATVGITPQVKNTLFGAYQIFTYLPSYKNSRKTNTDGVYRDMVCGQRRWVITRSHRELMAIGYPDREVATDPFATEAVAE